MASTCVRESIVSILGEKLFVERIVNHWNRVPREMLELPPLELCKRHVEDVLRDIALFQH